MTSLPFTLFLIKNTACTHNRDSAYNRVLRVEFSYPFILYCMKATGLECPCSSVVDPMEGGSTITS